MWMLLKVTFMELLSAQQIKDIKDAVQVVTKQFFVTPVILSHAIDALDKFNEDRKSEKWEHYAMNGMLEFPQVRSQVIDSQSGATQQYDVKVTFNYRDFIAENLSKENETIFNQTKDTMKANGKLYRIINISLDGPIEAENVLVIFYGKQEVNKT